jgi:glycerophosphoryl diester phosphodiesterase
MLKLAKAFDVDEISLHHSLINKNLVANAKRDGFNVVVWTVNRPSWLVRACKLGIHAVITDDPLKFKQLKTKI